MGYFSSGFHASGYHNSGYYGLRVQRVYTTDADRVITPTQERVIRAKLDARIIAPENIERLVKMPGVEVVSVDNQNRVVNISLDDRIITIDNVLRITEAD